jgi:tetratricopeptide (TPR) repeat protein
MQKTFPTRPLLFAAALVAATLLNPLLLHAGQRGQTGQTPLSANLQQASALMQEGKTADAIAAVKKELESNPASARAANMLDTLGATSEARVVLQRVIDAAPDPAAKSTAERAMAMSFAFDGDCANTVKHEQLVMAYWVTREQAEPQNAFYQQGEMANEAARVCIDSGDLAAAERWYRAGAELGLKEPSPQTHAKSLWQFRLAHALGRIAARQGNKAEAQRQIAAARAALDGDPAMAGQQERFFPYLVGYVALYTNDLKTAEAELTRAVGMGGNQSDPFMQCLLAMTYEKQGQDAKARDLYGKAYGMATAHNPPAAFVRRFARTKVAAPAGNPAK